MTSPLHFSPRAGPQSLPTIINTSHSPDGSPDKVVAPSRPSRSPSRASSDNASGTLHELTEMLGGAINEIQRNNSLENTSLEVSCQPQHHDEPENYEKDVLTPSAPLDDEAPLRSSRIEHRGSSSTTPQPPSVIPARAGSLLSDSASESMPPPPVPGPQQIRRHDSTLSFGLQTVLSSPTSMTGPRPWPAAMMFGNIKSIRYPGDRAKAYAKSINAIARADSGLRGWCLAISSQSRTLPMRSNASSRTALGMKGFPHSSSSLSVPVAHGRNVSTGSEFPMRTDAYSAREIHQRIIDPLDQPSALPPNLPYPQLQQLSMGGGMKTSQSMQSMASTTSKKGGFFSNIGKKSSKKDSVSLGPPPSMSKKDVRGLPISSPSSYHTTTPPKSDDSRSVTGISGPRGPRSSFTPPPPMKDPDSVPGRSSLDTGIIRPGGAGGSRGSLDGHVGQLKSGGPRNPTVQSSSLWKGGSPVKEDDLRSMSEVLPHADRNVLRAYLSRHGDQMKAIGAFIEDEQRGHLLRPL
ncbi:hypothetical protein BD324DRAFT_487831 [Kockovaella imperatae]|uniref:CUE domain-containing protein n=1 Tax=Kockovaella imperatae TaxID=4999 RepID=A0A1Y1UFN1_9TREE|nr:hypothetical protein BD324DRAFT_487831 [Kockovaella imperatae]ORX36316.1 hypothetical protein BD324DRAFT_487831 [Kockovaella imperatae]